jgi:hypothetical protein
VHNTQTRSRRETVNAAQCLAKTCILRRVSARATL